MAENPDYIGLYIDTDRETAKVGMGYRNFLVLDRGKKWATLLYIPTVTKIRVPVEDLLRSAPVEASRSYLKARLREAVAYRKKLNMPWSESGVNLARQVLSA